MTSLRMRGGIPETGDVEVGLMGSCGDCAMAASGTQVSESRPGHRALKLMHHAPGQDDYVFVTRT